MVNFGLLNQLRSVDEFGAPQQISTGFASWLRYCTEVAQRRPTKLCTMFRCLLDWYNIYIFSGSCPVTEFCHVQNSLCVQVLRSPIMTALLRGTRAAAVSQTLWRGTRNGITELSERAPPIFGLAAITLGIADPQLGTHYPCPRPWTRPVDTGNVYRPLYPTAENRRVKNKKKERRNHSCKI